mgnify:CR=1 FL=1
MYVQTGKRFDVGAKVTFRSEHGSDLDGHEGEVVTHYFNELGKYFAHGLRLGKGHMIWAHPDELMLVTNE